MILIGCASFIDNEWEIAGITTRENNDQKHIIFLPYNLLEGEYWIQLYVYYEHDDQTNRKPVGNLDWVILQQNPLHKELESVSFN